MSSDTEGVAFFFFPYCFRYKFRAAASLAQAIASLFNTKLLFGKSIPSPTRERSCQVQLLYRLHTARDATSHNPARSDASSRLHPKPLVPRIADLGLCEVQGRCLCGIPAHAVRKTQSAALRRGAPSPSSVALPLPSHFGCSSCSPRRATHESCNIFRLQIKNTLAANITYLLCRARSRIKAAQESR
jgi:hypothetical protein